MKLMVIPVPLLAELIVLIHLFILHLPLLAVLVHVLLLNSQMQISVVMIGNSYFMQPEIHTEL